VSEVTVELHGLELFGYHGATEEERRDGQRFLFDVELLLETRATETDSLAHTLDYRDAAALVREVSDRRSYVLLEALAAACAETLLQRFPLVQASRVRVRKPDVELDDRVEYSAATVERSR
jgi:dihydroneopterin aldolase